MNKRIVVAFLATLFLVSVHFAEAQQPAKIPRIGYVSGAGDPPILGLQSMRSAKGCGIVVILRGKTSSLSIATLRGGRSAFRAL